ncbi:MAG TPA: ribonuclease H [Polyangiaceae bacterium]|nr:ribonuclease H [Polyangiaceae bacterium]
MPWVVAELRGQRVFARCAEDGALVSAGGRVEIRYKPTDGRAYQAAAGNLAVVTPVKVLPDDHCAPADAAPRTKEEKKTAAAKKATTSAAALPADAFVAYTDGACSGNPGPAGLGVVVTSPDGERHEASEYLGAATNNIAELTAILRALEAVAPERALVVHTDSQYAIGVLTKGWKAKANVELVAKTVALVKGRRGLRLVYVPGHAGVPLNERADELARLAVSTRKSTRLPALGAAGPTSAAAGATPEPSARA